MKLDAYLRENDITPPEFARVAGLHPVAVGRYVRGERTPNHEAMGAIWVATDGEVGPLDFYDLPELEGAVPFG